MLRAAVVLLFLLLLPSAAHAEKRVALVIGNSSYRYAGELTNPKNDATDMAEALRTHGFQVIDGFDLNKTALERKIREFANGLQGAEVGVFFYAGHGLQVSGQNYIVPTDAQLTTVAALELEVTRFDAVQRIMESEDRTNILFFDACRDNPLALNLAQAMVRVPRRLAVVWRPSNPVTAPSSATRRSLETLRSTGVGATHRSQAPWSDISHLRMRK